MSKVFVTRAVLTAITLALSGYELFVQPDQNTAPLFVIIWCALILLAVLKSEGKGWHLGVLKLPPGLQLILSLVLILTAVATVNWATLAERRLFIQAGWTLVMLWLYRGGLIWAWSQVKAVKPDKE